MKSKESQASQPAERRNFGVGTLLNHYRFLNQSGKEKLKESWGKDPGVIRRALSMETSALRARGFSQDEAIRLTATEQRATKLPEIIESDMLKNRLEFARRLVENGGLNEGEDTKGAA